MSGIVLGPGNDRETRTRFRPEAHSAVESRQWRAVAGFRKV